MRWVLMNAMQLFLLGISAGVGFFLALEVCEEIKEVYNMGVNNTEVYLSEEEFQQLVDSAPRKKDEILLKLAGVVGLRLVEIENLKVGQIEMIGFGDADEDDIGWFFDIGSRKAYIPEDFAKEIYEYCEENDLEPDDPLLEGIHGHMTNSGLKTRVRKLASKACDDTGDTFYESVSISDLRKFYAIKNFSRETKNLRAVMKTGGWCTIASVERYLPEIDEEDIHNVMKD